MSIGQKGNIERDIKAAANTAKTARNTRRTNAIQRTKNEAAKAAKEAAELKAKGNIAKARTEAAKEAAAEAQRKRNEKRKQKFDNLLTQFNKDINNSQKTKFRQRFNMAQEQRKLPMESRSNNASRIIKNGGLSQIASELRKIKANKNEAVHEAAITRAKAAGSAAEVAKQKTAYLQKRQASFNKMIQNAKNRHSLSSNQRPMLNMLITNLTTKFNLGQEERKKNGPQNQTIINAGKIPELAKAIRELEREFNQKQRNKNAQNIKNAQEKAKKAETNRNQAQIQSKKYKEQSEKYKKRKNALAQNIKKVVEMRNTARKELENAKKKLATASTQSEAARQQAKANLEAAQKAATAARNELAKSKDASKLANKKRELTNLAREQRVLQNLAPNGLTPNGIGPRRPFSTIINGLTVNDLANGGLAGKLPNQIEAAGTAKKANQNAKKKAEMEAAEKKRQEKQETKRKQREAAAAKAKANQEKRETQKESVIKSIKKAQNASKAKALRERLNKMKAIITEKRKANEAAKAKENANRLAREKAAKEKQEKIKVAMTAGQRKKEITKLLNSYNNRLGSKKWPETKGALLNKYTKSTKNLEQDKASLKALLELKVQGRASKKAAKNLAAKKVANNLAAKKVANNLAAKSAAATKIQAKVRGRLIKIKFAEYKPLKTKLESNPKLPRNEKRRLMNMLVTSYTNQDRSKFREVRKMIENKNQQRAVSNLVAGAIKKASSNELVNARLAYRTSVLMAAREGRLPQNQKDYWTRQANTAMNMSTIQGVDKMFKIHLEKLKREKNAATKIQAAFKGGQVRKSVGGSSMGKDILKKHISGVDVMAGQKIPGFSGKRVEDKGYERDWIKRVDEEGDTAVKRAKLKKIFDDKFKLKTNLLQNEQSNVRKGYGPLRLRALKTQVMRPRYKQDQSTKGTDQNVAILNVKKIREEIQDARIKASMNRISNNPMATNNRMPKKTLSNPLFNASGGFNGGIRLGSGGNKAINGSNVKITFKKAKPSLKNITQKKVIRPARMASQVKPKLPQGPTAMKLGVQAAVAKNKLGKAMTNVERRVAARKAAGATGRLGARVNAAAVRKSAEGAAEAAKEKLRKNAVKRATMTNKSSYQAKINSRNFKIPKNRKKIYTSRIQRATTMGQILKAYENAQDELPK